MPDLKTEITIAALPAEVWATLVDLERYGEWNPFIIDACGEVVLGVQLRFVLLIGPERTIEVSPTVTELRPARRLEWFTSIGAETGVLDARQRFELRPEGEATHVVHTEVFTGDLVAPVSQLLVSGTRVRFEAMNHALKHRVERHPARHRR